MKITTKSNLISLLLVWWFIVDIMWCWYVCGKLATNPQTFAHECPHHIWSYKWTLTRKHKINYWRSHLAQSSSDVVGGVVVFGENFPSSTYILHSISLLHIYICECGNEWSIFGDIERSQAQFFFAHSACEMDK